jgi:hypothetical protein
MAKSTKQVRRSGFMDDVEALFKGNVVLTPGEVAARTNASSVGAAVHALNALVDYGSLVLADAGRPKQYARAGAKAKVRTDVRKSPAPATPAPTTRKSAKNAPAATNKVVRKKVLRQRRAA